MEIEVAVKGLKFDPNTNSHILLLQEKDGERNLPVWIGFAEAHAIQLELAEQKIGRPLTHDLLKDTIEHMGGKLEKIVISDFIDNTYYAKLCLIRNSETIFVDCRPSDAIALALRCQAGLFIKDEILDGIDSQINNQLVCSHTAKSVDLKKDIRQLDPSDFGKFKFE